MTNTRSAREAIAALQGHEAWAIIRRSTRAGDRDTVGLVGGRRQRGRVAARRTARGGRARGRPHRRPAAGGAVPAGARARLRGARRRHAAGRRRRRDRAGVLGRRGRRGDRRRPASSSPTAAASTPTTRSTASSSRRSSRTRSARARAPTWSSAGTTARPSPTGAPTRRSTVFRRLLERERGAYWTFVFFTGDRYLIGASPERHVTIHGGDVRMNPISGTFRLPAATEPATCASSCSTSSTTRRRSTSSSWSSTRSSR